MKSFDYLHNKLLKKFFNLPLSSWQGYVITGLFIAAMFVLPLIDPDDWELIDRGITQGLQMYTADSYYNPPWTILYVWPFHYLGAIGVRLATLGVLFWLAISGSWSIQRFLALLMSPFFIFAILFSNINVLVITLPILLWEQSKRWQRRWLWLGFSLPLLVIKPQGSFLLLPLLIWEERRQLIELIKAGLVAAGLIVPVSLLGSPMIGIQWLTRLQTPTAEFSSYWEVNNISLVETAGWLVAVLLLPLAFSLLIMVMRWKGRRWSKNHTYAALLLSSMLLSPYSSTQTALTAFAFIPAWPANIIQYILTYISGLLEIYKPFAGFWILFFGLVSLWFYRPPAPEVQT